MDLWLAPDTYAQSERPPTKRLPRRWHNLLEACYELTVMTQNYQACYAALTSEAVREMDDVAAGRRFVYGFYTGVFYQDAVIQHTKTVMSFVARIYGMRKGTPNQLKTRYHKKADKIKERTDKARNAIAHGAGTGGRFVGQALTEEQWWEVSVAVGIYPKYLLDEFHYAERGKSLRSGAYDEIMKKGPQGFLGEVATILHDFEQEILAPG